MKRPAPADQQVPAEDWKWERSGEDAWHVEPSAQDDPGSDVDEDGVKKPCLGEGQWGWGPPMSSQILGRRQEFADGFGLCSPGRWPPCRRRCAADTLALALAENLGASLVALLRNRLDLHTLVTKLASGVVSERPFNAVVSEGRELVFSALENAGAVLPVREVPQGQP